jgi:hypothetical protein
VCDENGRDPKLLPGREWADLATENHLILRWGPDQANGEDGMANDEAELHEAVLALKELSRQTRRLTEKHGKVPSGRDWRG